MTYLRLLPVLLLSVVVMAAEAPKSPAKTAKPSAQAQAMTPKQKEARRVVLAGIIARQEAIMDQYNKQSSFKAKGRQVTSAEYEKAREKRDEAQAERDSLAN